ncbi:MAG TPA: response regulator [Candidatus Krumholzibacterium sp.]|nr:response regulator [Candidatus Krumholzibacterium sp.]
MAEDPGIKKTGTVRVLLMDDEPMIRDLAGRMFENLGYEYSVAEDGQDAIDKYEEARRLEDPFQIVILDWNVSRGMGGCEAAERLREIDPGAVIIASSGDTAFTGNDDRIERYFTGTVSKPYTMMELKSTLSRFSRPKGPEETS